MAGKRILMLIGEYSEQYGIVVFQQAMEAVGHRVDIICPGTQAGDRVTTSVDDFDPDVQAGSEHRGHSVEVTVDFDNCETDEYDALYIAGGRGPEYIRTYPRVREIVREFHLDDKAIFSICRGLQVLIAVPDIIAGIKVAGLFTVEPEVNLTKAVFTRIGPKAALRDGNFVTAERQTALPAFLRECMAVLGTEIVHHPIEAVRDMAAE